MEILGGGRNTTVRIDGKTFRFVNGVADISSYERQSRISKLIKYAKDNKLGYRLQEGDGTIYRP